jgi:hypothetical protein
MQLLNLQNKVVKEFQHSKLNKKYIDDIILPTKDFLKKMINARKKIEKNNCCSRSRYINFFR